MAASIQAHYFYARFKGKPATSVAAVPNFVASSRATSTFVLYTLDVLLNVAYSVVFANSNFIGANVDNKNGKNYKLGKDVLILIFRGKINLQFSVL